MLWGIPVALARGAVNAGIRWKDEELHWSSLVLTPLIERNDPVILLGLNSPVKYVRLVRRKFNVRNRFYVQLINEGKPFQKPKHTLGAGIVGLDIGSLTIAITASTGQAKLLPFCDELADKAKAIKRLQRQMARQLRANNPDTHASPRARGFQPPR